jgi:hypothetical protein
MRTELLPVERSQFQRFGEETLAKTNKKLVRILSPLNELFFVPKSRVN